VDSTSQNEEISENGDPISQIISKEISEMRSR